MSARHIRVFKARAFAKMTAAQLDDQLALREVVEIFNYA
jgi:hypothetical protein